MSLYLKKVDAIQFSLTDEQKENIRLKVAVYFENARVKYLGGQQYLAVLQQGENLIKIYETQWLVRHPDGMFQILWPDQFGQNFIKGNETENIKIGYDPFLAKTFNQPNTLI